MEAWEKVLISDASFLTSTHGKVGCVACHGGVSDATEMAAAHKGVVRDPTVKDQAKVCGSCHAEQVKNEANGLHATLNGYKWLEVNQRGADAARFEEAFKNHCFTCHTTCGQCHVSRPAYTGNGLLQGHTFKKRASQNETCLACHSARVGDEYQGNNKGIQGDVHYLKGGMPCVDCHSVKQFHGEATLAEHRYQGQEDPDCRTCHKPALEKGKVQQHDLHGEKVQCQVCHSAGAYKNCTNCHVFKDDKGLPARTLDPSWMDWKIGRNVFKSAERPYNYVLVRHAPAVQDIFAYYKIDLPKFDTQPTWRYTTPHNIQRKTPQTESCNNCHGNAKLFLTEADLQPYEKAANKNVVVTAIPPKIGQ